VRRAPYYFPVASVIIVRMLKKSVVRQLPEADQDRHLNARIRIIKAQTELIALETKLLKAHPELIADQWFTKKERRQIEENTLTFLKSIFQDVLRKARSK
jgi:hypothetical protein